MKPSGIVYMVDIFHSVPMFFHEGYVECYRIYWRVCKGICFFCKVKVSLCWNLCTAPWRHVGGRVLFHTFLPPSISRWSQFSFRNICLFQRCSCITVQRLARSLLCSSFGVHTVRFCVQRGHHHLSSVRIIKRILSRSDCPWFFTRSGQLSESEAEDDPGSHVTLPQKLSSRGNLASTQSALRLIELGPRLTLQASPVLGHLNLTDIWTFSAVWLLHALLQSIKV